MYLSVIIPAYNEEKRVGQTLKKVEEYLAKQQYESEIIVVDDGSSDGTKIVVQGLSISIPRLRLISYEQNQGKGNAVKVGMNDAQGKCRLFMDADGSTPIDQVEAMLPFLYEKYDVVVSSRRVEGARIITEQPRSRLALGWVFRQITQTIVHTGIKDTQNGFKLFKDEAAKTIFPALSIYGWAFDVEVLAIARQNNMQIKEVPIVWTDDRRSGVRLSGMINMLIDLVKIKRNIILNKYTK